MIYFELFYTFFLIGAFTFGGGYAMLPLIKEAVVSHNWITEETLIDFVAVSESTPGPFAVNMATYVGSTMGGILGAACATLGVVLPSFLIILLVARIYEKFKTNKIVMGCMSGLKPAVVGLISSAILSIVVTVFIPNGFSIGIFKDISFYISAVIFAITCILTFKFKKVHPIFVICISAALGIAAGYIFKL